MKMHKHRRLLGEKSVDATTADRLRAVGEKSVNGPHASSLQE